MLRDEEGNPIVKEEVAEPPEEEEIDPMQGLINLTKNIKEQEEKKRQQDEESRATMIDS